MNAPHLISDLSIALPAETLSRRPEPGHWRVVDYACEDMKGRLLYAGPETDPPEIRLPLGLQGWHRITVGLWGGNYMNMAVRLKLTDERCFTELVRERPSNESIEEASFTCADLTGKDLVIAPPAADSETSSALAYIRCEPLSSQQIQELEADRRRDDCRKVIAYNDGISFLGGRRFRSKEDLGELIEPYRHSDVESLFWGLTGDITTFPTEHGKIYGRDLEDFPSRGARLLAENLQALNDQGINPLTTALEYAHAIGLQFHVYQRLGAGTHHLPSDALWMSDFYLAHPEWYCVNGDGIPIPRLSYAYPQVRRHVIDLLAEVAGYGVDGVNLCFLRGPAFVMYEAPLVDGFRRQFGEDPRELDEWDERWLRYRCGPMTEFVKELRQELDQIGSRLGKRLALSATTFPTAAGNLFYGLDLETWIAQGLVDRLTPYGITRLMHPVDVPYYAKLTQNTSCHLWPHLPAGSIKSRTLTMCSTAAECRQKALEYYEAGAEGLAIWDMDGLDSRGTLGPVLRRLGHIQELRSWAEEADKPEEPVIRELEQLGDIDMRVYAVPATHQDRLYPDGVPCHVVWWPS